MRATRKKPPENLAMLPTHKLTPQDEAAERNVIGCALAMIDPAVADLPGRAFLSPAHRQVWDAILALRDEGLRPEPALVLERMGRKLPDGWGPADVIGLGDVAPTGASAAFYARQVRDAWEKRRALLGAHEAAKAAYDPTTSPEEVRQRLARAAAPSGAAEIVCSVNVAQMVDEAERALVASGRPLYHRGGELVRVADLGGGPRVQALPRAALVEDLSSVASWVRIREVKGEEERVPALPPREAVDALMARGRWALPELVAVVSRPVLRPDGTVLQTPGYDAASRILYAPTAEFPIVPERPTREQARVALDELADLFVDFPFVERSDRSAALAFVLTLVGRRAIEGPCPMFPVRAAGPGTGKNLLVDVVSKLVFGKKAERMSQGRRGSEEEEKRLVALGREGAELALIDNVDRPLGSDVLAAALTSTTWRGRVLGQSATVEVPVPVFAATGNNVQVSGDLGRRVVPIDMIAHEENPEERTRFKHVHLEVHVLANRPRLVAGALTILRWFVAEGRPAADLKPFGSFEAWSGLVRDCLVYLGEPDPCLGRARIRLEGDPRLEAVRAAWHLWSTELGPGAMGTAQLVDRASRELKLALAEATGLELADLMTKLGHHLRHLKDRPVGGLRLERGPPSRGSTTWRVVRVEAEDQGEEVEAWDEEAGGD